MTRKFSGEQLVIATHNQGKLEEIRHLFEPFMVWFIANVEHLQWISVQAIGRVLFKFILSKFKLSIRHHAKKWMEFSVDASLFSDSRGNLQPRPNRCMPQDPNESLHDRLQRRQP